MKSHPWVKLGSIRLLLLSCVVLTLTLARCSEAAQRAQLADELALELRVGDNQATEDDKDDVATSTAQVMKFTEDEMAVLDVFVEKERREGRPKL